MTAIGYGCDDPADSRRSSKSYWPADLHLVGKEIIRFHCVYWPAFLLAAGLPLPKAITPTAGSSSKSRRCRSPAATSSAPKPSSTPSAAQAQAYDGPAPFPDEYWKHEQDLFASDVLRYFLLREIPFGQDGSFSFDALVQRYNTDLANGYGNLVSRTLTMIEKNLRRHTCCRSRCPPRSALAEACQISLILRRAKLITRPQRQTSPISASRAS